MNTVLGGWNWWRIVEQSPGIGKASGHVLDHCTRIEGALH